MHHVFFSLAVAFFCDTCSKALARGCNRRHIFRLVFFACLTYSASAQGWSDHLFSVYTVPRIKETIPCPEGASRKLGHSHGKCVCAFGYTGELEWNHLKRSYVGECIATPCPEHATPGKYGGSCLCEAPYEGVLQWVSKSEVSDIYVPHYIGECKRLPCPPFSHIVSSVEEVEVELPNGHELDMEENTAEQMLSSAAELFVVKSTGWTPKIVVEREPRCGCDDGFVGGYMWDYGSRSFKGGCMAEHPCPPGQRGAHPAEWITPPWKLEQGWQSPRAIPKEAGSCYPAPCPENSYLNTTLNLCVCADHYKGPLQWNMETEEYDGKCAPDWTCPENAIHTRVWITTAKYRLGCTCKTGYFGGESVWIGDRRQFKGRCRRAPCPEGTKWFEHGDALTLEGGEGKCACPYGLEGVYWSPKFVAYRGHCTKSNRTTTTTTTTSTTTTTTNNMTNITNVSSFLSGEDKDVEEEGTSAAASSTSEAPTTPAPTPAPAPRPKVPFKPKPRPKPRPHKKRRMEHVTMEELVVGVGMYITAAIAAIIGIVISCQNALQDMRTEEARNEERRHLLDESSSDEGSLREGSSDLEQDGGSGKSSEFLPPLGSEMTGSILGSASPSASPKNTKKVSKAEELPQAASESAASLQDSGSLEDSMLSSEADAELKQAEP